MLKRTWADISLDCLAWNYQEIHRRLNPACRLMAVVKADAYGHGATVVAGLMQELGADQLAVATIEEAVELRAAGIRLPILVLGYTPPELAHALIEHDLTQTIFDAADARRFSAAAVASGRRLRVHIKVDTGMTRLGFIYHGEADEYAALPQIAEAVGLPGLAADGIFTHFANADAEDDTYTRLQFSRFMSLNEQLAKAGIRFALRHCANSSALIRYPEMHLDMVRPGIILYGACPAEHMRADIDLHPAMSLRSVISQVKPVTANVPVSYNCRYRTGNDARIAVVEAGYADGLLRRLSAGARMLVHGQAVPIVGTICMDRCMLDVSQVADAAPGDIVTIFGTDGSARMPAEQLAQLAGTISYEIFCLVSRRVPRTYTRDDKRGWTE